MTMRKRIRIMGGFLLMLVVLLSMSVPAFAYAQIDADAGTSLTLKCVDGSTALSGADFRLYKVAEIDATNRYTLTEDFAAYPVSLENLDSAGWLDLAATLKAYAARDKADPLAESSINSAGTLTFGDLTVGLYLVSGDFITIGKYTYIPTPFIVSLPNLNANDKWEYDVTADVKFEKDYTGSDGGDRTTQRTVVKVWKNDDNEKRPESVTVQLLRNGTVYAETTLSEENNWRHTWTGLSRNSTWQLLEKSVPDDYTVSVSPNGRTFIVTNTHTPDTAIQPEEPDNPDQPEQPDEPNQPDEPDQTDKPDSPDESDKTDSTDKLDQPDEPNNPDSLDPPDESDLFDSDVPRIDLSDDPKSSGNPNTTDAPEPSEEDKLPQTGQLNWPIPLLAGGGLTLFAVGWGLTFLKRRKK